MGEDSVAKTPPEFPLNRVQNFYLRQAEHQLDSAQSALLHYPEFPGLDGGSFGHWGQNPEADNFEHTLNEVDMGNVVMQITNHFGDTTLKAVTVRIGDDQQQTALFDPLRLTFTDAWQKSVRWTASRYGLLAGIEPDGDQLQEMPRTQWVFPEGTPTVYLGFYRHGQRVVFVYQIGEATLYDHAWFDDGQFTRTLSLDGTLPKGARLEGASPTTFDQGETKALTAPGTTTWTHDPVVTRGSLGTEKGPYVIDTLTVPYRNLNPFKTPMRIGGLAFLPDGRAVVCTLTGDVWLIDGVDRDLDALRWTRFAAGLNQPLGLVVQKGEILVAGRDQITRLHDFNNDGEADYYECVSNQFETSPGNDVLTNLNADDQGTLYFATSKSGVHQLATTSRKPDVLCTGIRNSNGLGVRGDGRVVIASSQEGRWTPATGIFEVGRPGAPTYHGLQGPRKESDQGALREYGYDLPLCFIPRGVDNSPGALAFLPNDDRLGPLAGQIIGTSFGYCQHYLFLREEFENHSQGGVVPLAGDFLSGAHRLQFNSRDGCLYVAGTDGWQSYAQENGSLQRIRYVGGELPLPTAIETHENGFLVRFNCDLDPQSIDVRNVFCQQWNYLYSKAYGSAEFSVRVPGRRGHDGVPIQSVHLLGDGRSVFVEIPHLHPVMQYHLHLRVKTDNHVSFSPDLYGSIFHLRPPFTQFDGYTPTQRNKRYPGFPMVEDYPVDPRLVAQEKLGKTLDLVSQEIQAVPGLRFRPHRIRVTPGQRVGLTIKNSDVSMPHNFVLVTPDRHDAIGDAALLLASDPTAIARHYVPDDEGVIAFSPILEPREQYTLYFNCPKEKGVYPFACSYPGHWNVMRGELHVLDDDEQLPPETEPSSPPREFVREWKLEDLAVDANQLQQRSFARGLDMFREASCIKCHRASCFGDTLGPDLTDVSKRFKGAPLLQHILEPSVEINPQYQTHVVITDAGKVFTGLLSKEDAQSLHLVPNPLHPDQVTIIPKNEIEESSVSTQSTMPTGLLMTLSREEILDLLAFVEAGGDPMHQHFEK